MFFSFTCGGLIEELKGLDRVMVETKGRNQKESMRRKWKVK